MIMENFLQKELMDGLIIASETFSKYQTSFQEIIRDSLNKFDINNDGMLDQNEFRNFMIGHFDEIDHTRIESYATNGTS